MANPQGLKGFGVLVGGNWNNGSLVGSRYVNLNNLASNTNANIGSRTSYQEKILHTIILASWRKLSRSRDGLVSH